MEKLIGIFFAVAMFAFVFLVIFIAELVSPTPKYEGYKPTPQELSEWRAERKLEIEKELRYLRFWENKYAEVDEWWKDRNKKICLLSGYTVGGDQIWTKPITVDECFKGHQDGYIQRTRDYYQNWIDRIRNDIWELERDMP